MNRKRTGFRLLAPARKGKKGMVDHCQLIVQTPQIWQNSYNHKAKCQNSQKAFFEVTKAAAKYCGFIFIGK
jgi:hypothetical protein